MSVPVVTVSGVRFGAHLPLIDVGGEGLSARALHDYVDVVRRSGFFAVSANDHVAFQRPWLDGMTALASVVDRTVDLTLATTVALPVLRGPVVLAKAAAAMDIVSGGRFVLGVGPGSSPRDYDLVGIPFDERWPRFEQAAQVLRGHLADPRPDSEPVAEVSLLEPRPRRAVPIWIGSWGSPVGLRRVARLGDGWLASAYHTTPDQVAAGRDELHASLCSTGRDPADFPIMLATMWTYVTSRRSEAQARLGELAGMLNRDPATLADRVLIGNPAVCAERLDHFADVGVEAVFIWPLGDPVAQVATFAEQVIPAVR